MTRQAGIKDQGNGKLVYKVRENEERRKKGGGWGSKNKNSRALRVKLAMGIDLEGFVVIWVRRKKFEGAGFEVKIIISFEAVFCSSGLLYFVWFCCFAQLVVEKDHLFAKPRPSNASRTSCLCAFLYCFSSYSHPSLANSYFVEQAPWFRTSDQMRRT